MRDHTSFVVGNNLLGRVSDVLAEGTVVGGRYVLEARIGDGGMGSVYRAHHAKVSRQFAIKVLHKSLMTNPKVVKRFEREAELAGRLRHTNVVSVVDVGMTYNGLRYLAMELAPGQSLSHVLADGALSEARMLDLAKQLCAGLGHAHEVGLIHRDFKPDNVIVEQAPGGREIARIVDFGVAILRDDAGGTDRHRLTTKGIVVGTPHYMAPEQARGGELDSRVDLFALGLICYEMLCGKLPFEGTGAEVARSNLLDEIPVMAERAPEVAVDRVLEAIVRMLLAKDPDARPQTAYEARELLELYERDPESAGRAVGIAPLPTLASVPVARISRPHTVLAFEPIPIARPAHRRRWLLALVPLAALCMVALLRQQSTLDSAPAIDVASEPGPGAADQRIGHETPPPSLPEILEQPRKNPIVEIMAPPKQRVMPPHSFDEPPTATEVAQLYAKVGRELKALDAQKGMDATIDLWPRYRWIRINDAIATPEKRVEATVQLQRLLNEIR